MTLIHVGDTAKRRSTQRSEEVSEALQETTKIVRRWIEQAEQDTQCPVWRFSSTSEMRECVTLPSLTQRGCTDGALYECMEMLLQNSVHPWTERFVDKLYTAPMPKGPAFEALLTAINANAHVLSAAPMLCLTEEACVASLASLCGWDVDECDGFSMPGGSSSNTIAVQTSLNSLFPEFKQQGVLGAMDSVQRRTKRSLRACRPLIFTGKDGHYSVEKAAMACGLGLDCVVKVPCDKDGRMNVEVLEKMLDKAFDDDKGESGDVVGWPFFINATAGSTVTGSFDALDRIADVCARYRARTQSNLWLHVDGSWGGPVLFSQKHRDRMNGIEQCDSFTINPHKLLTVPHQCSFVIIRKGDALAGNALDAPYLFHEDESSDVEADSIKVNGSASQEILRRKLKRREGPAMMNFGCGRRGDALKFYLAWLSQGAEQFERQVDEGIAKAEEVIRQIESDESLRRRLEVLHGDSTFLQVCFRPRLHESASVQEKSKATQFVHATLRERRRFAVDFAPLGQGRGDFIRMVTHPSSSLDTVLELVSEVAAIGEEYQTKSTTVE